MVGNQARTARHGCPAWFHLLVGPNGAGVHALPRAGARRHSRPPLEFVNADRTNATTRSITDPSVALTGRTGLGRSIAAPRSCRAPAFAMKRCSRTLPSSSGIDRHSAAPGYTVALHVVASGRSSSACSGAWRSACSEGGHPVPPEASWRATRAIHGPALLQAVRLADVA